MRKIVRYKFVIIAAMSLFIVLSAIGMASIKFTKLSPCENEPDHYIDDSGNGYCIAENLVPVFENTPVFVLEEGGKALSGP